jgi:hypothetical protein
VPITVLGRADEVIEDVLCCAAGVRCWHKAAQALTTQCPELAEEADISPKWGNSRFDPGCVKTIRGITAPGILSPKGHAESKKTQKFVFRSALRPNQISFSHSQDPMQS